MTCRRLEICGLPVDGWVGRVRPRVLSLGTPNGGETLMTRQWLMGLPSQRMCLVCPLSKLITYP